MDKERSSHSFCIINRSRHLNPINVTSSFFAPESKFFSKPHLVGCRE